MLGLLLNSINPSLIAYITLWFLALHSLDLFRFLALLIIFNIVRRSINIPRISRSLSPVFAVRDLTVLSTLLQESDSFDMTFLEIANICIYGSLIRLMVNFELIFIKMIEISLFDRLNQSCLDVFISFKSYLKLFKHCNVVSIPLYNISESRLNLTSNELNILIWFVYPSSSLLFQFLKVINLFLRL